MDSILNSFHEEDFAIGVLVVKELRRVDVHELLNILENNSVILAFGGRETVSWPQKDSFVYAQMWTFDEYKRYSLVSTIFGSLEKLLGKLLEAIRLTVCFHLKTRQLC